MTSWPPDPEVARYLGGRRLDVAGTAQQVTRFEQVWRKHGYGQSAVVVRRTGRIVGRVGLHPWPAWGEVELGFVLEAQSQGHGYAREAAEAWLAAADRLGLARLVCVVDPDNGPSRRLAERLGFQPARYDVTPDGTRVLVLGRTRPG